MAETFIKVFDKAIPLKLVNQIIELFNQDTSNKEAGITVQGKDRHVKDSIDLKISPDMKNWKQWSKIDDELFKIVTKVYSAYSKQFSLLQNLPISDTGYFIRHYPKGAGHYSWHSDAGAPGTLTRIVSMVMYLNDVDRGGETEFRFLKIKVRPKKGRIVVFPGLWTHEHRGCIPLSGDKYIITTFFILKGSGYEQYQNV